MENSFLCLLLSGIVAMCDTGISMVKREHMFGLSEVFPLPLSRCESAAEIYSHLSL